MDKVYDKCCGIDVHKKLIVACFRKGSKQELRNFGATTRELLELANWLQNGGCEMVAMESTASYWKPLYNILESSELKAMVVNASHMKAVPGRKTDTKDAEWIAELLQHGLLKASYIPDKQQRELRELVRYRKSLVSERTRELNRLQKMLEGANIKLSGTVSDINCMSARNILEYLLTGEFFDEAKYDEMYKQKIIAHNLKASKEQIIDDLNGVMTPLQRRMMKELLSHLDELNVHINNLEDEIDNFMKPEEKKATQAIQDVTGIGKNSSQAIISVIGTDMSRFPTAGHLAAWAGLCPGNNESAGKRKSTSITKGNPYIKSMLCEIAWVIAGKRNTYLSAWYWRIKQKKGARKAIVALARKLLVIIYTMLKQGTNFDENCFEVRRKNCEQKQLSRYIRELEKHGYTVEAQV